MAEGQMEPPIKGGCKGEKILKTKWKMNAGRINLRKKKFMSGGERGGGGQGVLMGKWVR